MLLSSFLFLILFIILSGLIYKLAQLLFSSKRFSGCCFKSIQVFFCFYLLNLWFIIFILCSNLIIFGCTCSCYLCADALEIAYSSKLVFYKSILLKLFYVSTRIFYYGLRVIFLPKFLLNLASFSMQSLPFLSELSTSSSSF